MSPSLELHDITVTVNDGADQLTILDRVDLTVRPGEVIGVTGPSGSGKSTLLAVAGLLRRPDRGTVDVAGQGMTTARRRARTRVRRSSIGFVFQSANLFPSLTAIEQIELVAHIDGRLDRDARARARDLLSAVGLDQRAEHRPRQLSGGERQRVGIARALMNQPTLLLADEPTAALDPDRGREVMAMLVAEASERGVGTVVVTHSPDLLPLGTRLVRLDRGRLEASAGTTTV